jgi:hypothetical protein
MARGVDRDKLAAWRRRLARHAKSGLTAAEFCRREQVSVSLWKYWQRRIKRVASMPRAQPPSAESFRPIEIIPRRSVLLRFPGGATLEIPDDRIDLVRVVIDRMAAQAEAARC